MWIVRSSLFTTINRVFITSTSCTVQNVVDGKIARFIHKLGPYRWILINKSRRSIINIHFLWWTKFKEIRMQHHIKPIRTRPRDSGTYSFWEKVFYFCSYPKNLVFFWCFLFRLIIDSPNFSQFSERFALKQCFHMKKSIVTDAIRSVAVAI